MKSSEEYKYILQLAVYTTILENVASSFPRLQMLEGKRELFYGEITRDTDT